MLTVGSASSVAQKSQIRVHIGAGSPHLNPRGAALQGYASVAPDAAVSGQTAIGAVLERRAAGNWVNRMGVELVYGRANVQQGVYRLDYLRLEIPFTYAYEIPLGNGVSLLPQAGLGAGWYLHQEDRLHDRMRAIDVKWGDLYAGRFRRVHPSVLAGVSVRLGPQQKLEAGLHWDQQLTPVYKDSFRWWPVYDDMRRARMRSVALRMSMRL